MKGNQISCLLILLVLIVSCSREKQHGNLLEEIAKIDLLSNDIAYGTKDDQILHQIGKDVFGEKYSLIKINKDELSPGYSIRLIVIVSKGKNKVLDTGLANKNELIDSIAQCVLSDDIIHIISYDNDKVIGHDAHYNYLIYLGRRINGCPPPS